MYVRVAVTSESTTAATTGRLDNQKLLYCVRALLSQCVTLRGYPVRSYSAMLLFPIVPDNARVSSQKPEGKADLFHAGRVQSESLAWPWKLDKRLGRLSLS